jgi:hypothetical protein
MSLAIVEMILVKSASPLKDARDHRAARDAHGKSYELWGMSGIAQRNQKVVPKKWVQLLYR